MHSFHVHFFILLLAIHSHTRVFSQWVSSVSLSLSHGVWRQWVIQAFGHGLVHLFPSQMIISCSLLKINLDWIFWIFFLVREFSEFMRKFYKVIFQKIVYKNIIFFSKNLWINKKLFIYISYIYIYMMSAKEDK
jgi:hypothetical protein